MVVLLHLKFIQQRKISFDPLSIVKRHQHCCFIEAEDELHLLSTIKFIYIFNRYIFSALCPVLMKNLRVTRLESTGTNPEFRF